MSTRVPRLEYGKLLATIGELSKIDIPKRRNNRTTPTSRNPPSPPGTDYDSTIKTRLQPNQSPISLPTDRLGIPPLASPSLMQIKKRSKLTKRLLILPKADHASTRSHTAAAPKSRVDGRPPGLLPGWCARREERFRMARQANGC